MPQHILQIGSHVGNTHHDPIFNILNPDDNVILVEPVPYLFEQLRNNYNQKYPGNKFIFVNKAVNDKVGELEMTAPCKDNDYSRLPTWASQLGSVYPENLCLIGFKTEKITVKSTTINQIIKDYDISQLDLLVVDTEGSDYNILMSYDFVIKPNKLIFEHKHIDGFNGNKGEKYSRLLCKLEKLGYKIIHQNDGDTTMKLTKY